MKWYYGLGVSAVLLSSMPTATVQAQEAEDAPVIDPEAMDALRRMGEYLRKLTDFQVQGDITTEQVLEDSQKITMTKFVDLVANRPNKLRMQIKADQFERILFFDGTNFTLFAPRNNQYATEAAPPSIAEFAAMLEDKHGIELPLVDLFRWGTDEAQVAQITAAKNIGPSQCGGMTCQHYAFRQPGLDWQVWIQLGDHPLPRKIVLTTLTDEARPQHMVTYNWNLAPSFNDAAFAFEAPANAKRILLADLRAETASRGAPGGNGNGNGNRQE